MANTLTTPDQRRLLSTGRIIKDSINESLIAMSYIPNMATEISYTTTQVISPLLQGLTSLVLEDSTATQPKVKA